MGTNSVLISLLAWQDAEQSTRNNACGSRKEKGKEKDPQTMGRMPVLQARHRILLTYPTEQKFLIHVVKESIELVYS